MDTKEDISVHLYFHNKKAALKARPLSNLEFNNNNLLEMALS
jgi:hypothetical protein